MNANIMKTQNVHKVKYDFKGHFYAMGGFVTFSVKPSDLVISDNQYLCC